MPNNLNVTLDTSKTPWRVDISNQGNSNEVSRSPNSQTITWQLTGNAASGNFVAMSDPNPGFAWVGVLPPAGVFGTPTVSNNGNQLTLSDLNNSASTAGTYIYMLRVNVGGTVYCSESTELTAVTKDPTIINK